jgi:glucose-1-phosphate thymidylyltransferase
MRTIILAGGYATRLQPITIDRPKPLLPVAGIPIIDHILSRGQLPGRPVVSTNLRFLSQFQRWQDESTWDVDLVVEQTVSENEKLGTVGAVAYLIEKLGLDDDILVIGGDNIFEFELDDLLSAYRGRPLIALFDLKDIEKVRNKYGVVVVENGRIVRFQEKPAQPDSTLASTACYVYPKEILPLFGQFSAEASVGKDAPGYFNEWLLQEKGQDIDPFIFDTSWHDIGDRASYIAANQQYCKCNTWSGKGVTIENSTVTDSVILDNSRIFGSSISGCVIDCECELVGVNLNNCLVGARSKIKKML